jgi:prephenate dehydrogenase
MMKPHFKQVAIVGVGLIGGSLGMILRRQKLADSVVGIGRRVENLKTAVEVGAIDRYVSDPREGVEGADFVLAGDAGRYLRAPFAVTGRDCLQAGHDRE